MPSSMGEDSRVVNLVQQLVKRFFRGFSDDEGATDAAESRALSLALRILGSRVGPSGSGDEAAAAEAVKRHLVRQGRAAVANNFSQLYQKLAAQTGPGSLNQGWALLLLLLKLAQHQDGHQSFVLPPMLPATANGSGAPGPGGPKSAGAGLALRASSTSVGFSTESRLQEEKGNGIVASSEMEPRLRAFAMVESLRRSEAEVGEEKLVRDIVFVAQGINGRHIHYDMARDAFCVREGLKLPAPSMALVRRLCELGWLFRKVQALGSDSSMAVGRAAQALVAAVQKELSDYYRLIAFLEAQLHNPVPSASGSGAQPQASSYLSLRRLAVWLHEPQLRMRMLAMLADACRDTRGGALAGVLHAHTQHGDPLARAFVGQLLRSVCTPLFAMVRRWVLAGELEDVHAEFFIRADSRIGDEGLWREGYRVEPSMLPSFIPPALAERILRTGKSINFLRRCCADEGWAAAAAAAAESAAALGYGDTAALETLVGVAAARIDQHLLSTMFERYKLRDHCLALKRYLLLGQGDFIQSLMDGLKGDLDARADTISAFKLAGTLETAVRTSNAQYDDADLLDRVRVKMMPHAAGDRGWDVFSLEYMLSAPLTTLFPGTTMARYLRVFNFLWRLKRVEAALSSCWLAFKPNSQGRRGRARAPLDPRSHGPLQAVVRRSQALRNDMTHFVTNLQYYIMFEVLETSWTAFEAEISAAQDLDQLIAAHDNYLSALLEKALLGERSQLLAKTLTTLFALILQFKGFADRLQETLAQAQARADAAAGAVADRTAAGTWGSISDEHANAAALPPSEVDGLTRDVHALALEYSSLLEGFLAQLPTQQHVDLRFLYFRLDFSEFYSRQHAGSTPVPLRLRRSSRGPKS